MLLCVELEGLLGGGSSDQLGGGTNGLSSARGLAMEKEVGRSWRRVASQRTRKTSGRGGCTAGAQHERAARAAVRGCRGGRAASSNDARGDGGGELGLGIRRGTDGNVGWTCLRLIGEATPVQRRRAAPAAWDGSRDLGSSSACR